MTVELLKRYIKKIKIEFLTKRKIGIFLMDEN
ncbi:hypothetical protein [Coxiella burnetii]|uniref:Uncharacterized protein n=2 Tax=Coxiella burnetii TaxID=777 RepID=Q83AD0_COXBU|nr:hypothetical protein [Coxiella burnetii]NP_820949.1 hypothetical protein CBU_1974 [Coxiella burnetii RSA 493]AAO91463.1 hypothetical protein CBU_1974 [Coxiella burnetii RSA 493]ACI23231.1 hypothetical protein CBUD_2072a [Coxiella burnetii Dugway 5J108-111]ACJ19224.1 hypothetical protein CbuG_1982 [Coxiella burnetii CbuG_Q212]ACJ21125.1 hypothetical protein CbuK_2025 [Coxiella burnetii CbuK_Q154]AIT64198.1 hypothetical protein CBNA_2010 [Coxiella burnetii str. Namibia]